jgi:acyl carrier protein phosphodiesterase
MDELGIAEIGFDKARYKSEMDRMNSSQRENFKQAYSRINDDFKKAYPTMTEKER